jgi:transposase
MARDFEGRLRARILKDRGSMSKKKTQGRARRKPAAQAPSRNTALDQMRHAAGSLLGQGKAEEAVDLLVQAVDAVLRQNRNLELMVMKLQRERVGKTSEQMPPEQLALAFEEFAGCRDESVNDVKHEEEVRSDATIEQEIEKTPEEEAEPKPSRPRGAWKGNVERREHHHELPEEARRCEACGLTKERIGEETTSRLAFVPGHFIEHVHHLAKYACGCCREGTIPVAPAPPQVIERSAADATLLAHIVVGKFADHSPLTRLTRGFARSGVEIPVSTLSDWVGKVSDLLSPLVDEIAKRVLAAYVLGTDATGLKVLDPSSPENIQRGAMWCYVGGRFVLFRYTPTSEGATGPWEFLKDRKGYVQADAHSVYDRLYQDKGGQAIEVGCWFHARRRFFALKDVDIRVAYPLLLIRRLFRIEHLGNLRKLAPDDRVALRRERSQDTIDRLKRWIGPVYARENPDSEFAKAIGYIINQWDALTRFIDDGRLGLDNSEVERQIRYVAIGRKNYLFAGSHRAAERAARLYSLTRSCALHGVPPMPYFVDVLRRLAAGWPQSRIAELLPDVWEPASRP